MRLSTPPLTNALKPGRNRKLLLALATAALAVSAFLVWLLPGFSPAIVGDLSREDCKLIIQITRRSIWDKEFPTLSWQTIKGSPRSLYVLAKTRICHVEALGPGRVQVR